MSARMSQERTGVKDGQEEVILRVALDHADQRDGYIEVTALVRVPKIDSDAQIEHAAREAAKIALHKALEAFPL